MIIIKSGKFRVLFQLRINQLTAVPIFLMNGAYCMINDIILPEEVLLKVKMQFSFYPPKPTEK